MNNGMGGLQSGDDKTVFHLFETPNIEGMRQKEFARLDKYRVSPPMGQQISRARGFD